MFMTDFFKAAAKTATAAIVGLALSFGIEVPADALELVLIALFVGGGSIVLNMALTWLQRFPVFGWVRKYLPGYQAE